jgi:hypothetical protein
MERDSRFDYWFIGSTTFIFVLILVVYHQQTKSRFNQMQAKLQQVTQELEEASANATASGTETTAVANQAQPKQQDDGCGACSVLNSPKPAATAANDATKDAASHITQIDRDISALESRMSSLGQTKQSIDDHASTNQKSQLATVDQQKSEFDNRIATLMQQIGENDLKLKAMQEQSQGQPPEIPFRDLRNQRFELENELQRLNAQKSQLNAASQTINAQASGEATKEKDRLRQEEEDLKHKIAELKSERETWVKKQTATPPASTLAQ